MRIIEAYTLHAHKYIGVTQQEAQHIRVTSVKIKTAGVSVVDLINENVVS